MSDGWRLKRKKVMTEKEASRGIQICLTTTFIQGEATGLYGVGEGNREIYAGIKVKVHFTQKPSHSKRRGTGPYRTSASRLIGLFTF